MSKVVRYGRVVANINGELTGVIIATYEKNGVKYFDVRVGHRVYYETRSENWVQIADSYKEETKC